MAEGRRNGTGTHRGGHFPTVVIIILEIQVVFSQKIRYNKDVLVADTWRGAFSVQKWRMYVAKETDVIKVVCESFVSGMYVVIL